MCGSVCHLPIHPTRYRGARKLNTRLQPRFKHLVSLALFLFVISVVNCSSDEVASTPVDEPSLNAGEVLGVIADRMRSTTAFTTGSTCHLRIERDVGWDSLTPKYDGNHKWSISSGSFRWTYFERTGAIQSSHTGNWARSHC